ncbi:MAG: hypothetical protein PW735_12540 [Acidobacteriaceae bacterium]|nr:hypothetical protein [Acidobacteriaceae bacterium]
MREELWVRLGEVRYRVERPFGELFVPAGSVVSDVATDQRGHLFALLRRDPSLSKPSPAVVELTPEGALVRAWGEEIADAHMLACDPATGHVLVVDRDAHEIVRYSVNGERLGALGRRHCPGEPFSHPTDIACMPGGELVVADGYGNARVHIFSADGVLLRSIGAVGTAPGEFLSPHSVCALGADRFVVADRENHRLQVFTLEGELKAVWDGFFRPQSVWTDGIGKLFVTDSVPSLSLLSWQGERLSRCRPVLNGAHGLSGNAQSGVIYLAETNPSRLTRLLPETK